MIGFATHDRPFSGSSVIIPAELNYVLNPFHPDFTEIEVGKPESFAFDPRLLSRRA